MDQYVDGMNQMDEVSGSISRWDELDGRGKWINK